MRQFNQVIFCGWEGALEEEYSLKKRMSDGLNILSGLQQPGHSDSEAAAKMQAAEEAKDQEELYDIVKDITMALTGKEWTIK